MFLLVICLPAKPFRIHAEFSGHLDVHVGKVESLSRINPHLVFRRSCFFFPIAFFSCSPTQANMGMRQILEYYRFRLVQRIINNSDKRFYKITL